MELIRIKDLSIGYEGETPVVDHIDLTVGAGDYIGIIGPNGGGKTTFIRTLTGALPPLAGSIEYAKGLRMGYLPQTKSIDNRFLSQSRTWCCRA